LVPAGIAMLVPGASHGYGEFGELSVFDQFQVCSNAPGNSAKHSNS